MNYISDEEIKNFNEQCMLFNEEQKHRDQLSVNMDIDGVLSCFLISYVLRDKKVYGYNNAKTFEAYKNGTDEDRLLMLDYFVKNENILCIDQHCNNPVESKFEKNKLNPNSIFGVTVENYTDKYGGNTAFFILSVLEHLGYNFSGIDIYKNIFGNRTLFDMFCRADSFLDSICRETFGEKGKMYLCKLCHGLDKKVSLTCKIARALFDKVSIIDSHNKYDEWKKEFDTDFKNEYHSTKDEGFLIIDDENGGIKKCMKDIYDAFELTYNFTLRKEFLNYKRFVRIQCKCSHKEMEEIQKDELVDSSAIVYQNQISVMFKIENLKEAVKKYWKYIPTEKKDKQTARFVEVSKYTINGVEMKGKIYLDCDDEFSKLIPENKNVIKLNDLIN